MAPGDQRPAPLRVSVVDAGGRPVADRGLAAWLAASAPVRARGSLTVALVSDSRVRLLNHTYRNSDYATDVLSFPAVPVGRGRAARATAFLGDIVIARGVARRQARAARHSESTEWRVLALHGLLHLLGYDHERDTGQMEREEQRLRRAAGLADGVIERATNGRAPRSSGVRPPGARRPKP